MELRTFMRFVPIAALLVTATGLYFGASNYLTLESARATSILKQLGPLLRQAHVDILASLARIESKLNITNAPRNGTAPGR